MKIAIVVDGGQEMGMGHIVRGITLAEELKTGASVFFVTKSDGVVFSHANNAGYNIHKVDTDEEKVVLLRDKKPDVVIIDRLEVPEKLAAELKGSPNMKLVIFDNLSDANKHADVVVNCVMGSGYENREYFNKKTNTLYYYGLKYEVLRREFYQYRKTPDESHGVENIMLIFGGSDFLNLTTASLDVLLQSDGKYVIDVVIGSYFKYFKELAETLRKYPEKMYRVKLHRNAKNVAELMYHSDLVLASPGLSVFEALCVRVPVIAIHQNEPQKFWFQKFMPTLSKGEVWKLVDIISGGDYINPFSEYISSLEVGEGKDDVIKAILGISK